MILPWLKSINIWLAVAFVLLGAAIVSGAYISGIRHEQRIWALEMAARNKPIAEQRGRDEVEVPAEDARLEAKVGEVSAAVTQSCVLTPETARLLSSLR
jgi:hypothetical protein